MSQPIEEREIKALEMLRLRTGIAVIELSLKNG